MLKTIQFGTDGIRGKAGQFPFEPNTLIRIGQAIEKWGQHKYKKSCLNVLIGHDSRESCEDIKKSLAKGLSKSKITDAKILPTPAILQIMKSSKNFDFGIVISASHNPYTDNGIKLFDGKTGKLNAEDEKDIVKHFLEINENPLQNNNAEEWKESKSVYEENIIKLFNKNFLSGKKIILDCANGATYKVAPEIFTALGAQVIPIGVSPNGKNINELCGALHPENAKKALTEHSADIAFSFDGDGDRVIAVNKNGEIKDGDDLLCILMKHKDLKNEPTVVGTIMTNFGFESYLLKNGKNLVRTKVGDKYVGAYLEKEDLSLGGESSGHIIIRNYLNTGDGIFVALKTLESIIENNNWEMKTFEKTPQLLINVKVKQKKDLAQDPYSSIIKKHESKLINGRIIVRYSGTENLLRIMVEDEKENSADSIAHSLKTDLTSALKES